jgi:hypothetical protein
MSRSPTNWIAKSEIAYKDWTIFSMYYLYTHPQIIYMPQVKTD